MSNVYQAPPEILVDPTNMTHRAIYADTVAEHDYNFGQFMTNQCQLDGLSPNDPRYLPLQDEVNAYLADPEHFKAITQPIEDVFATIRQGENAPSNENQPRIMKIRGGFPDTIRIRARDYLKHATALHNVAPLTGLELTQCAELSNEQSARLSAIPELKRLQTLTVDIGHPENYISGIPLIPALAATDFQHLKAFKISRAFNAGHLEVLGGAAWFKHLESLSLHNNHCLAELTPYLTEPSNTPNLKHLDVSESFYLSNDVDIAHRFLEQLATSHLGDQLHSLNISSILLTDADLEIFTRHAFKNLRSLNIADTSPTDAWQQNMTNFLNAPSTQKLESLSLSNSNTRWTAEENDAQKVHLLRVLSEELPNGKIRMPDLRHLSFDTQSGGGRGISESVFKDFLASPVGKNLHSLNLFGSMNSLPHFMNAVKELHDQSPDDPLKLRKINVCYMDNNSGNNSETNYTPLSKAEILPDLREIAISSQNYVDELMQEGSHKKLNHIQGASDQSPEFLRSDAVDYLLSYNNPMLPTPYNAIAAKREAHRPRPGTTVTNPDIQPSQSPNTGLAPRNPGD